MGEVPQRLRLTNTVDQGTYLQHLCVLTASHHVQPVWGGRIPRQNPEFAYSKSQGHRTAFVKPCLRSWNAILAIPWR